jgi:hypothetical protein
LVYKPSGRSRDAGSMGCGEFDRAGLLLPHPGLFKMRSIPIQVHRESSAPCIGNEAVRINKRCCCKRNLGMGTDCGTVSRHICACFPGMQTPGIRLQGGHDAYKGPCVTLLSIVVDTAKKRSVRATPSVSCKHTCSHSIDALYRVILVYGHDICLKEVTSSMQFSELKCLDAYSTS